MVRSLRQRRTPEVGNTALASLIKGRRVELGMTQKELASPAGKAREFVSLVEREKCVISSEETVLSFARTLDVDPYTIYSAGHVVPEDLYRDLGRMNPHQLRRMRALANDLLGSALKSVLPPGPPNPITRTPYPIAPAGEEVEPTH